MKKITRVYHGTTMDSAIALVKSNFDWTEWEKPRNWNCSWPNQTYGYAGIWEAILNNLIDSCSEYEGPSKGADYDAILYAFENAQVAAAMQNATHPVLVVFGWDVEYESDEEDLFDPEGLSDGWTSDVSCPYMNGAVQINDEKLSGRKPDVIYLCRGYHPMLRVILLPMNAAIYANPLEPWEEKIARAVKDADDGSLFEVGHKLICDTDKWEEASIEDIPTWRE